MKKYQPLLSMFIRSPAYGVQGLWSVQTPRFALGRLPRFALGRLWFIVLLIFILTHCTNGPLTDSEKDKKMKLNYFVLNNGTTSASVVWGCSSETTGILGYGKKSLETFSTSPYPSKVHIMTMPRLSRDTNYVYQVFCGEVSFLATSFMHGFRTKGISDEIAYRGIWILGGTGLSGTALSQVDVFDPVDDRWYPGVTNVPTPRLYAGITSHKNKIYVMGGLTYTPPSTYTPSSLVEIYDVAANTWSTGASMPATLQGFLSASIGEDIYTLGGSTTAYMQTGTVLNTVYKFTPSESGGIWSTKLSQTAMQGKVDMGGCAIDGTFFFNTGRFYSDGSAQSTQDAYVPGSNTTTTLAEAAFGTARHGATSVCYRPFATDPYPNDTPAVLVVGGSTATDVSQPVSSVNASDIYEYYIAGPALPLTNIVQSGPVLPVKRYQSAMEISYKTRKAYVFGGMLNLNSSTDTVYSIDLSNPIAGPWSQSSASMPLPRYGHKALVVRKAE